jgi:hypothetical protein
MKRSQLALFVFLALLGSFFIFLYYNFSSTQRLTNYKFKSERYIKDYYQNLTKYNYLNNLIFLIESTRFNYFSSFCNKDKDFLFFGAKKLDEKNTKTKEYTSKELKKCLGNLEFNVDTLQFYKSVLLKSNFEINSYFSNFVFPFFSSSQSKLFIKNFLVVNNTEFYKITCYYKDYISFNKLFLPNLLEKTIYVSKINIYNCFYSQIKKPTTSLFESSEVIYLNNIPYYFALNNVSFSFKKRDLKNYKEEILSFLEEYPEINKNLTIYGKAYLNDNIKSLSIYKYSKYFVKINNNNYFIYVPCKDYLIIENNQGQKFLIRYFIK